MIEMRWLTPRKTIQHHDGMIEIKGEPVLQTREIIDSSLIDCDDVDESDLWSEWQDVPTVYIDE